MTQVLVLGAGTVGAAIAYGLARQNCRVTLLDGGDTDHRAARANFGLVWLQGKGAGMPAYHRLTRQSVDLWPSFSEELAQVSGAMLQYERTGGLKFCLNEQEVEARHFELQRLHNMAGGAQDWEMLDRPALERLLPGVTLGAEVVGASYGHSDGHCNPLRLLAALQRGVQRLGGRVIGNATVQTIRPSAAGFEVETADATYAADRLVIAAGLGSAALARQVGLTIPVRPQRGQILVTERCAPLIPMPASGLRQTGDGTVMIGSTQEEVGFDSMATGEAAGRLSRAAVRILPRLASARVVRQWAGLRVMTPDSFPIYAQAPDHPGAFVALCHSGVTLAALHATHLAAAVAAGALPDALSPFHQSRFDVSQTA